MWTKKIQHSGRGIVGDNEYKGIPIYAGYKVHDKCFELFIEYVKNKNSKILILGAGAGAFDQRLIDAGYNNILAVEYNEYVYRAHAKVLSRDLNRDFTDLGIFDVIVAMEVIEHLENHFDFFRQINTLLAPGGLVLVTTPNTESDLSRIKFFLTGQLNYFSKTEIATTGHINPLFNYIFRFFLNTLHLKIIHETYSVSVWNMNQYSTLRQKLRISLLRLFGFLIRNKNIGQISIFICQKY